MDVADQLYKYPIIERMSVDDEKLLELNLIEFGRMNDERALHRQLVINLRDEWNHPQAISEKREIHFFKEICQFGYLPKDDLVVVFIVVVVVGFFVVVGVEGIT